MTQPLIMAIFCLLLVLLVGTTVCDKDSTADHISPASLTTLRGAHLVCHCDCPVKVASDPGKNWVEVIGGAGCATRPYSVGSGSVSRSDGSRRRSLRPRDHQHHFPRSCAGQALSAMLSSYALQIRGVMNALRSRAILATAKGTQLMLCAGWASSSPCWG